MLFTKYFHHLHHLKAVKMVSSKLFLICMFKDKFGGKLYKFGGKSEKKSNSAELDFCNSVVQCTVVHHSVV